MKKNRRNHHAGRIASLLIVLCMVLSLVPTLAYADEPVTATADFTTGDGVEALALLNDAKTGTTDSTWDSATKTLTLKGVNFTTTAAIAVKLPVGSTIVLEGENTITGGKTEVEQSDKSYGICAEGDLTIQGAGMLTATGGTARGDYGSSHGIYADNVTISDGTVTATGGKVTGNYGWSCGIYAYQGAVTISGCTTKVTATGDEAGMTSTGIYAYQGAVTISDSATVTATGGTATSAYGYSDGIDAYNVTISGSTTKVTATGDEAGYVSTGIYAYNVTISGTANVTATGDEATGENGKSYGIDADGSVTISGGRLLAQATAGAESCAALSAEPDLTGYATYYWRTDAQDDFTEGNFVWKDNPYDTYVEITDKPTYSIIEGANGVWTQNSDKTLIFRANGDFSKFTGVKVDDTLIDAKNYTAVSGSTVVTLKADYLKTLSVGTHKLTVVYTDGECSTNFEVKQAASEQTTPTEEDKTDTTTPTGNKDTTSPQTGDNSNMFLWVALLFVSGGVLTVFSVASKKKAKMP